MEVDCKRHGRRPGTSNLNCDIFCSECIRDAVDMIKRGEVPEARHRVKEIQNFAPRGAATVSPVPRDPEPYLEPEYWRGRRLVLRAGACLVRADAALSSQPVEFAVYKAGVLDWLVRTLAFPAGDQEEQLRRAYLFCVKKTPAFVDEESASGGLWDTLETDYLRVLEVMES